jgi:hypothetical protein
MRFITIIIIIIIIVVIISKQNLSLLLFSISVHSYSIWLISNYAASTTIGGADYVTFVRCAVNDLLRCCSFSSLACKVPHIM